MSLILNGTDHHGSPFLSLNNGTQNISVWSPFGATSHHSTSLPGFNGERADPFSGVTHLGNGYRAYSPVLRRFTCPDSESPFGVGGINPYAYCEGDPINNTDPSGHGLFTWIIRKVLSLSIRLSIKAAQAEALSASVATCATAETSIEAGLSIATGMTSRIAAATGQPAVAKALGWASMGLGVTAAFGAAEVLAPKIRNKIRGLSRRINRTALNESSGEINFNYSEPGNGTLLEGGNSIAQPSTSGMGASGGTSLEFHELPRVAYDRIFSYLNDDTLGLLSKAYEGKILPTGLEEGLSYGRKMASRRSWAAVNKLDNVLNSVREMPQNCHLAILQEAWLNRGVNHITANGFNCVADMANVSCTRFNGWVGAVRKWKPLVPWNHKPYLPTGFNGKTLSFITPR